MAKHLQEYNRKRHFDETAEPHGKETKKRSKRLRFVVQHHIATRDHYDFRLEWDGVLKSWAVPKGPSYDNHDKRLAVQVEDHPLEYRNFEGTIPKGQYGGGTVMIWDEGEWEPLGDAQEGLASGALKFVLRGDRLKGKWALIKIKPRPGEKDTNWLLIKEKDAYENAYDIKEFSTSSKTGRTMSQIEEHKKPLAGTAQKSGAAKETSAPDRSVAPASGKASANRSADDVTITHPEKILYKDTGITKGAVADYYRKIAGRMLPYLANRIVSAVRCPGGIESCFFKKHPSEDNNGIVTVPVPGNDGTREDYFHVADAYGLLSEVQMNTLEFHTWGSRVQTLEQPDMMVFDLDPDEGMDLERIRQGVTDLKSILDQLSLVSYLKTSGGKGYHVVIPFRPAAGWDVFHDFARNTAKTMEAKWSERYTSNVRKNRRSNRIFIDWMRNGRGATSIAPYSVRAREGAPVSMPITWNELATVEPGGISMQDAIKRLRRKDPWADFFTVSQELV